MATERGRSRLQGAAKSPARVPLPEGTLVLPPVALADLPPGGVIGSFLGIAALRFSTPVGTVAVFLHDLTDNDIARVLDAQRREAEAQLGAGYARGAFWWGRP